MNINLWSLTSLTVTLFFHYGSSMLFKVINLSADITEMRIMTFDLREGCNKHFAIQNFLSKFNQIPKIYFVPF